MKFYLITFACSLFLLFSCNKEQRTIKKMTGKWNVTDAHIEGAGQLDPDLIFEFEQCNSKQEEYCECSIHDFMLDQIRNGIYSISPDGSEMEVLWQESNGYSYQTFQIQRLSFNRLILVDPEATEGDFNHLSMKFVD